MGTAPGVIIAYTSEDGRFDSVVGAAEQIAREAAARLILYDADAASRFSEPLPSNWSGQDSREIFDTDALSPEELEMAGRHAIAEQVRHARSQGIEAFGWLPRHKDAEHIAAYADREHADLIMLPSALEEPGLMGKLRGESSVKETIEKAGRPLAVVDEEGHVEYR